MLSKHKLSNKSKAIIITLQLNKNENLKQYRKLQFTPPNKNIKKTIKNHNCNCCMFFPPIRSAFPQEIKNKQKIIPKISIF